MSIADWVPYVTPKGSISHCIGTIQDGSDTPKRFLNIEGEKKGHFYLLPNEEHAAGIRGQMSGCFRTLYRQEVFPLTSEIRIYCMMSQENLQRGASCYAAGLTGDRRIILYKYSRGLVSIPEVLCSLRLPGLYRQGVLGLMWSYNPRMVEGVFLRSFLSVKPEDPQQTFRLFDYLDRDNPLTETIGEGFGVSLTQSDKTRVIFRKTALHAVAFQSDSKEDEREQL